LYIIALSFDIVRSILSHRYVFIYHAVPQGKEEEEEERERERKAVTVKAVRARNLIPRSSNIEWPYSRSPGFKSSFRG
jgi:hypothetical protein